MTNIEHRLDPDKISRTNFLDIIAWSRKIRAMIEAPPEWVRMSLSAEEVYNLAIEAIETVYFFVKEEHFRTQKENPEIRFSLDKVDSLYNPVSYKVRKRNVLVSPSPKELDDLLKIQEAMILLKKNRSYRPLESFQLPMKGKRKKPKRNSKRKQRKKYFYVKK